MRGYRLTTKGKIVLIIFVMLLSIPCTSLLRGTVAASDNAEYSHDSDVKIMSYVVHASRLSLYGVVTSYSAIKAEVEEAAKTEESITGIMVEDIKTHGENKIAFLTFDDGPSEHVTMQVLDILDTYNVKATFFVLGSMCEKNGNVLKEIHARKHSIGIHSYSHIFSQLYKNEESFINEVKMTEAVLKKNLGEDFSTRLFRFPGGSFEPYKNQYIEALNEAGYVSIDWNALTGDTEAKSPTHEMLLNRLKSTVIGKNNVVILMHDSDSRQCSVEVLPDVIEYLRSEGYEFAVIK